MADDLKPGIEGLPPWERMRDLAGLTVEDVADQIGDLRIPAEHLSEIAGITINQPAADWMVWSTLNLRETWQPPLPWGAILKDLEKAEKALSKLVSVVSADRPGGEFLRSDAVLGERAGTLGEMLDSVRQRIWGLKAMRSGETTGRRRDDYIYCYVVDCSEIWRQHGGEGRGAYKSDQDSSGYDGRLLRLIEHLLQHVGFEPAPSPATIYDHIMLWTKTRGG